MLQAVSSSHGLVFFSGLSGSGKTTSAHVALDYVNANQARHICTVQTSGVPIPSKKSLVQQREVGSDVPDTLAGIRAAMAQDLDVVLVEEIQSLEEMEACIAPAQTGHLVITTLHAATPQDAIRRVIEAFPEDLRDLVSRDLAHYLRGVSTQRLLPRPDDMGRTAAYGVLIPDDEMRRAIAEGGDFMARETPMPEGCQTLAEDIERLRQDGAITDAVADAHIASL